MGLEKARRKPMELVKDFIADESGSGKPVSGSAILKGAQIAALTTAIGAGIKHFDAPSNQGPQPIESILNDKQKLDQMIEDIANSPVDSFDEQYFSKDELKCLTDNVYHEARGESTQGKDAVIYNVLSRTLDKRYPKSICGVVYQPFQFSWTRDEKVLAQPIDPRTYLQVSLEVHKITKGRDVRSAAVEARLRAGLPHGAIFYKKKDFTGSQRVEKFFAALKQVATIGKHNFYIEQAKVNQVKQKSQAIKGPVMTKTVPLPVPSPRRQPGQAGKNHEA